MQLYSSFLPPAAPSAAQKIPDMGTQSKMDHLLDITWTTAEETLPVLHKYDMQALLYRLMHWIEGQKMSGKETVPGFITT
jgi:hypothetical protein